MELKLKKVYLKRFGKTYHMIISKRFVEDSELLKVDIPYEITFSDKTGLLCSLFAQNFWKVGY